MRLASGDWRYEGTRCFVMKIKLNSRQIAEVSRRIQESDRKTFSVDDVTEVFRMLRYWIKSHGSGEEAIKSIVELPDGYVCRVNRKFRDSMKAFFKERRALELAEDVKELEEKETLSKYDQLIREAEERASKSKRHER